MQLHRYTLGKRFRMMNNLGSSLTKITEVVLLAISVVSFFQGSDAFMGRSQANLSPRDKSSALGVSELHIPGYAQSKLPFILQDEDLQETSHDGTLTIRSLKPMPYDTKTSEVYIPHQDGYLIHKTRTPMISKDDCERIIEEAEYMASLSDWTKNRHGNYPTTDLPLVELPETLKFLRIALVERIYPMLQAQYGVFLPDPAKLRLADGFVVKYDAAGGQRELKPHRDGSVLSFNIALNPTSEFEGGGTWFASLDQAIKIDQGQIVSHASALLHGGHGISSGKRYILVGFVIVEGYDSWSMRFYNQVRNL
eukprot:scaffold4511_cov171-Amphora_coffeaeformis.AAC.20